MIALKEPDFLINELSNPPNLNTSLAKELFQEASSSGRLLATSFYTWLSISKQALKVLTLLSADFPSNSLSIVEHYSDYFKLKLVKHDNNDDSIISIGKLFGLIERCKDTSLISEYSVSQTTMEQIFQSFANNNNNNASGVSEGVRLMMSPVSHEVMRAS